MQQPTTNSLTIVAYSTRNDKKSMFQSRTMTKFDSADNKESSTRSTHFWLGLDFSDTSYIVAWCLWCDYSILTSVFLGGSLDTDSPRKRQCNLMEVSHGIHGHEHETRPRMSKFRLFTVTPEQRTPKWIQNFCFVLVVVLGAGIWLPSECADGKTTTTHGECTRLSLQWLDSCQLSQRDKQAG